MIQLHEITSFKQGTQGKKNAESHKTEIKRNHLHYKNDKYLRAATIDTKKKRVFEMSRTSEPLSSASSWKHNFSSLKFRPNLHSQKDNMFPSFLKRGFILVQPVL